MLVGVMPQKFGCFLQPLKQRAASCFQQLQFMCIRVRHGTMCGMIMFLGSRAGMYVSFQSTRMVSACLSVICSCPSVNWLFSKPWLELALCMSPSTSRQDDFSKKWSCRLPCGVGYIYLRNFVARGIFCHAGSIESGHLVAMNNGHAHAVQHHANVKGLMPRHLFIRSAKAELARP